MRSIVWLMFGLSVFGLGQEVMTPEMVASLQSVVDAKISPDGTAVAVVRAVPRVLFEEENGSSWSELHVWTGEKGLRPYVSGQVSVRSVAWTPDGSGISFLAKRGDDKHAQVYVIPVDGGEARRLFKTKSAISAYSWASDMQRMAFLAKEEADKDKKDLKEKGFNQEIYEEDYQLTKVWVVDLNDENAEPMSFDLKGSPSELSFSPDGTMLSVALAPTPLIDDFYMLRRVHVIDAKDGSVKTTFDNPGKLGKVVWSPDNKRLAMISGIDINDPSAGRILVGRVADGSLKTHLAEFKGKANGLAWADSKKLYVLADHGVTTSIVTLNADNGKMKTIHGSDDAEAVFTRMDVANGVFAMVGQSPQHPGEAFTMTADGGSKRLTVSNPQLADIDFAKQEVIRYKAKDGLEVEGILIRPLNEEKGKQYPLVLIVHGGPESHFRNGWMTRYSYPGQVGAARGFAQFYPNYRGSTGRGLVYSKMSQGDPAGKEFDDLVDAVDHLIEMGLVDKDRVGVTGGSYGGYATAWCTTYYSERFAAGAMFVGISNKTSKAGTTDIPDEEYYVHALKRVWEDEASWKFFLERSPVYHAKKGRSPLLILHGKEDPRVHPGQSMELYRQLKSWGKAPVRLVFYPGEGHGNRKASARYDYNLRLLRWMEHYLTGEGGTPPPFGIDYPAGEDDQ